MLRAAWLVLRLVTANVSLTVDMPLLALQTGV